uniref:Uncharacterized protein n=1 Tax=Arundo donax TaxID=35708 RepID=A0A0A9C8S7_ARUDO
MKVNNSRSGRGNKLAFSFCSSLIKQNSLFK